MHAGERFRCSTQPWTGLLYDEIDSGRWRRVVFTGNVQSGKTLSTYVIPVAYHLFEWREAIVAGVPEMRTAGDKYRREILPVINAQPRFRKFLPATGAGSQGGFAGVVTFTNGAELRFMAGTGGDETRSNYTARVAAVTEADRIDTTTGVSRESAPIFQIERRTESYNEDAVFYAECTVTIAAGFVWREYQAGSRSTIVCPCAHCGEFVSPERDDLVDWQDCESEIQAAKRGRFACPICRGRYDDKQRRKMNEDAVLLHRGQSITRDGEILGEPPETYTLGFRTSAFNNLFWSTAKIAAGEWAASRNLDAENAERDRRQFVWVLPLEPGETVITPLAAEDVLGRTEELGQGILPAGTIWISGGVDVRKSQVHFVVIAWLATGAGRVVDVGVLPVDLDRHGVQRGIRLALRAMAKRLNAGYPLADNPAKRLAPGWVAVDAGYRPDDVRGFCAEQRRQGFKRFIASWGRGQSTSNNSRQYSHPQKTTEQKPHVGQQYYIAWDAAERQHGLIVNADAWKSEAREALAAPTDQPGAVTLFHVETEAELKLARQFARETTAEVPKEVIVPGRGPVVVWENTTSRANHLGDCFALAMATGHLCGVRVVDRLAEPPPADETETGLEIEGLGAAYLASQR